MREAQLLFPILLCLACTEEQITISQKDMNEDMSVPSDMTDMLLGGSNRCWVECVQLYSAGCIHTDLPVRIMGITKCTGATCEPCIIKTQCTDYLGTCTKEKKLGYQCLDGTEKVGAARCFTPVGGSCENRYLTGYGPTGCENLCLQGGDACQTKGKAQPCEVHCGTSDGVIKPGVQSCEEVGCDDGVHLVWSECRTKDACLK